MKPLSSTPFSVKVLDTLTWVLGAFCLFLIVTGGHILRLPQAKIEFSSLDPWMVAWLLLLTLRWKIAGKQAAPVWVWLSQKVQTVSSSVGLAQQNARFIFVSVALLLWTAHLFKHYGGFTYLFDVTFIHQSLFHAWNAGQLPLHCDLCDETSYFGEHLALSFLPLAPLASLFKGWILRDVWIFLIQSILIMGSAYIVLVRGFRSKAPEMLGVAALVFVAHRAVRINLIWDFREDHLAFAALCLSILALLRGRWILFLGATVLAALCKENVAAILPFLTIPILLERELPFSRTQRKSLAAAVVIFSIAWLVFSFRILIPMFNPNPGTNEIAVRLAEFGKTPAEVLVNVLTSPSAWWKILLSVFNKGALKYLALLLLPWLYFSRRAWVWWAPALPGIAMNLLSTTDNQRSLYFHYEALILPFLMTATWIGIQRTPKTRWVFGLILAVTVSGRWPGHFIKEYWPNSQQWSENLFLQKMSIPGGGQVVAAFPRALAHLNHFPELRMIRVSDSCRSLTTEKFIQMQRDLDMTQVPSHSVFEASLWIIDQQDICSPHIETFALQNGWKLKEVSHHGRWKVWELPKI